MRFPTAIRLTAAVALMAACASPTEPAVPLPLEYQSLVGDWIGEPEPLGPNERYTNTLVLRADGTFTVVNQHYGAYTGQGADDLSSANSIDGVLSVDGDRATFRARRITEWDLADGANSKPRSRSYEVLIFREARFALEGDQLTLNYLSYPADAPLATTKLYQRALTAR